MIAARVRRAALLLAALLVAGCEEERPRTPFIQVASPQVYTRERLINQRLEDEKWLRLQLTSLDAAANLAAATISRRRDAVLRGAVAAPGEAAPGAPAPAARAEEAASGVGDLDFETTFLVRSALREVIQHRILENQLDDRHDLDGNALYILKFDIAVGAPPHAGGRGLIEMRLQRPSMQLAAGTDPGASTPQVAWDSSDGLFVEIIESPGAFTLWARLLDRWRDGLEARINEAIVRLHGALLDDDWPPAEHKDFAQFLGRRTAALGPSRANAPPLNPAGDLTQASILESPDPIVGSYLPHYLIVRAASEVLGLRENDITLDNLIDGESGQALPFASRPFLIEPLADILTASYLPNPSARVPPYVKLTTRLDSIAIVPGRCTLDPAVMAARKYNPWVPLEMPAPAPPATVYVSLDPLTAQLVSTRLNPQIPYIRQMYEAGKKQRSVRPSALRAIPFDMGALHGAGATATATPRETCASVEETTLRSGLVNFVRRIQATDGYSYAVMPRQSVRAALEQSASSTSIGLGGAVPSLKLDGEIGWGEKRSGSQRRTGITSFSRGSPGDRSSEFPTFGWIIDPKADELYRAGQAPDPIHASVIAIVSVPSWWTSLSISGTTGWLEGRAVASVQSPSPQSAAPSDQLGGRIVRQRDFSWSVPLPNALESIDSVLVGSRRRKPTIIDRDLRETTIHACRRAEIIIPGHRLWRGSRVFLGGQEASEISVLPDMSGLRAVFAEVSPPHVQARIDDKGSLRPAEVSLRVWTSEGVAESRRRIDVVLPEGECPKH